MEGKYQPDWVRDEVEHRFYHHYPLTWIIMEGVLTSSNRRPLCEYHVRTFEEFYSNKLGADQCTIPQVRTEIEKVNHLAKTINSLLCLNTPEETRLPKLIKICDIALNKTTKPPKLP